MSLIQEMEDRLNLAFNKSGLTPEEFYSHIISTRKVLSRDDDRLSFKVTVFLGGYEDLEWFGWNQANQMWVNM